MAAGSRTSVTHQFEGRPANLLAGISLYRWHCAGLTHKNERRLFCIALSPAADRQVLRFQKDAARGLPMIYDGGIAILNVLFDIDRHAVETFWWNAEA